jgi:hypothetical protein
MMVSHHVAILATVKRQANNLLQSLNNWRSVAPHSGHFTNGRRRCLLDRMPDGPQGTHLAERSCRNRTSHPHRGYLSVYLSVCLSIYLSICLSTYISFHLPTYLPITLSIYLYIYLSVCLSVYLSIYLSVYLSIYLSIYLHIFPSTYLPITLSICLCVCLSVYGSTVLLLDLGSFFSFLILYTVGTTPWTGIRPSQGRYLHTEQHKHRINAHTNIHALSRIGTHDPVVRAGEDSSLS